MRETSSRLADTRQPMSHSVQTHTSDPHGFVASKGLTWLPLLLAVISPNLLGISLSPSATLLNQLLAIAGWGTLMVARPSTVDPTSILRDLRWLVGPLLLLIAATGVSAIQSLPSSSAWESAAMLGATAAVCIWGFRTAPLGHGVLLAWALAGLLNALIAVIQVFFPEWADGTWIAKSGLPGRAVGNLRQPNHLSTMLLWGLIALVPVAQARRWWRWAMPDAVSALLGVLMTLAVVLTASRTGVVGIVLLALWGVADRRLRGRVRAGLVATPVVYLLCWLAVAAWAHHSQQAFGGEARLAEADLSASRFGIWANTWALIQAQPWFGVGWGEFNFAWTLTPFPGRPTAFFDHSHNLVLQLAVELGVPAALLILGLLVTALVQAFRRSWSVAGDDGAGRRAACMIVVLAGLHSLLEYPLWYAYFLLPTAWAFGYALSRPAVADDAPATAEGWTRWLLPAAGALMLAGAAYATWEYRQVVRIYQPGDSAGSLTQRIDAGQRTWFFSHHADYAAATTTEPPSQALGAMAHTTHVLLDTRLMMAWARALAESGHVDEARYVAARLKEFRNPASKDFFAVCEDPAQAAQAFQCQAPTRTLTWRDLQRLAR